MQASKPLGQKVLLSISLCVGRCPMLQPGATIGEIGSETYSNTIPSEGLAEDWTRFESKKYYRVMVCMDPSIGRKLNCHSELMQHIHFCTIMDPGP